MRLYAVISLLFLIMCSSCANGGYVPLTSMVNVDPKKQEVQQSFEKDNLRVDPITQNQPDPNSDVLLKLKRKTERQRKKEERKKAKALGWEKWPPKKKFLARIFDWK
jgi:hypothetical protein